MNNSARRRSPHSADLADGCLQDAFYAEPRPGPLRVESVDAANLAGVETAWRDLCARALESNIFLEPAFAMPLIAQDGRGARVLLVWDDNTPASFGRLLGLFPLAPRRGLAMIGGIARGWVHNQAAAGTPLVDRQTAPAVFAALFDWLRAHDAWAHAVGWESVAADGPFHAALSLFCATSGRPIVDIETHARAALRRSGPGAESFDGFDSMKRRKEHARQVRRLAEAGRRAYVRAETQDEVAAAAARFLALENTGWKGRRGTSLLADPRLTDFFRAMTARMAAEGKCRIDSLEIDGRPIAMGIILRASDRAYFWKTAFDERFAGFSPGVQLTVELSQAQLADPAVVLTDSCAIARHPMIDRIWAGRRAVTDVLVAVRPDPGRRFAASLAIDAARRAARRRAKAAWLRLRKRRNG